MKEIETILTKEQFSHVSKAFKNDVFKEIDKTMLNHSEPFTLRKKRISALLNESIVSEETLECSDNMFRSFLEKFENDKDKRNGGRITVNGVLGEKNITASFQWQNTDSPDNVSEAEGGSSFRCNGEIILIYIYFTTFRGNFKSEAYKLHIKNTLLHEIDHIFKQKMMGHTFHHIEAAAISNSNLYSNSESDRMLAYILYAANEAEQDAMCAELYQHCMQIQNAYLTGKEINSQYKKPSAYQWLENLYIAHDYLLQHKDSPELLKALEKYQSLKAMDAKKEDTFLPSKRQEKPFDKETWAYKKFKNRADRGIKRFEMRIAQTLKKTRRELVSENQSRFAQNYLDII